MESDDQSQIPTKPAIPFGMGEPVPEPVVTDAQVGGLLNAARSLPHSGEWQPPSPEEFQRDFPQYEIRGILGRGGMGAVYKGWQKSLDRSVAIKILPPGFNDGISDFTERFKREAKAMAHLKHPGIVAVYDAGTTEGGLLYFIMECIEGTDVQKLVAERGRIEPAEALRITEHVCNALGYAHSHGVIHRDIKPSNIMIEADGDVKVADFGLAKSTATGTTILTMSNVAIGTPDFMAPEAMTGAANVDHRADIYAVGVMLYQMLTGKLPRGKYDPPSRIVPGLDKRLDRIVDCALQPKPEARYASARDMSIALAPIIRSVGRRTPASGVAVVPRKKRLLISIVAVAAICAVAALVQWQFWKNGGTVGVASADPARDGGNNEGADGGVPAVVQPRSASKDAPFVNTLGQEFVPVPGTQVLFCRWETRVQDYAAYAKESPADGTWKTMAAKDGTPVSIGREYPVCGVSWGDATAFCKWLTEKERTEGRLPAGMSYRLPKDGEWSRAVGLANEVGATPRERHKKNEKDYPWGTEFPPPKPRVGNYADTTYHQQFPKDRWIEGYTDGFATTAPVGSFPPNQYGIHDLGGNLWEWCEDLMEPGATKRVGRGASWVNTAGTSGSLFSSYRMDEPPEKRQRDIGFRVVLDLGGK
ncbi:MAG: bifunctional serine/threonine-protein kinase/formylglycine-generating enzyme family protein [Chthoniobacteraceae bacterium]